MIRAEGAGQLKLALILLGDGDRGPGEELDELEQNERERVAAEDHHMRIDRDAAILEAVVEAVADGVGKIPCSSGTPGRSFWIWRMFSTTCSARTEIQAALLQWASSPDLQ